MNATKKIDVVNQLAAQARDYHRRGDVVLRNQTLESIRVAAPSRAYAAKVIRDILEPRRS